MGAQLEYPPTERQGYRNEAILIARTVRRGDAELEPFRHAGDGAPVRWLHQVI